SSGSTSFDLKYTYDLVGHKKSETDANGVPTTYEYDEAYPLTTVISAAQSVKSKITYGYDENGNRISETHTIAGVAVYSIDYTYDALNRLSTEVQHVSHLDGGAAANYETKWDYIDIANAVVVTDPRGVKTEEFRDF